MCIANPNGIDASANWIWYNWDPATINWPTTESPFKPGISQPTNDGEYLIFRLPVREVPGIECPTLEVQHQYAPPTPSTGFVVIDSDLPLDVTAVYTARAVQGEVATMDVEIVPEHRMDGTLTICP